MTNNEVVENEVLEEVCDSEPTRNHDGLKAGVVIGGTILIWEVGKKLCKKGYEKFVQPTKLGQKIEASKVAKAEAKAKKAATKKSK